MFAVIEHVSSEGGDTYRTIIRSDKHDLFYCYEDADVKIIDKKAVTKCEAYILFYKLKDTDNSQRKNIKSQVKLLDAGEMQLEPSKLAYVPSFWYEKFLYLPNPGMIITSHILCPHKKIKPDYFDCFPLKIANNDNLLNNDSSQIDASICVDFDVNETSCTTQYAVELLKNQSAVLPQEILEFMIEQYGGGPAIPFNQEICLDCIQIARQIRRRRRLEREIIAKYDKKITEDTYLVEEQWMIKWKEFLYSSHRQYKRNFIKGPPPPGPIDNRRLLGPTNELRPGLKRNLHYRVVNEYIWDIFKSLYGGSPALVIQDQPNKRA